VRSLMLDNNNISRIEGLDRMTELRSLHLGGNRISQIEGLESNLDLRHLNLESNALTCVANVRHLVNLESLNMSCNRVDNLEDIAELKELPKLSNMDISRNTIEAEEGVVEFWAEFKALKVLRYHGNGGVRHVTHYRKRIINALPQLTYLDERPVFAVERKSCQAWEVGGLTAMHEAKKEYHKARFAACEVDPDRKELVTKMRQMAMERLNREAKEREEKEDKAQRELDAKLGTGREAQDGDLTALEDYEKGWKTKVSLYGTDGVRAKVAQEMGPPGVSKPLAGSTPVATQAPAAREYSADFDFTPPSRTAFAPPSRTSAAQEPRAQTGLAADRRQERTPAHAADFCQRSSGEHQDHTDRVFSVLSDDVEVSMPSGGSRAAGQGAAPQAASDAHTMPLIWQNRQAETAAAESECMQQQTRAMAAAGSASPAAFRSNQLEGLD